MTVEDPHALDDDLAMNADLRPAFDPPEPPPWSVVAATRNSVRTFHTRTYADWVDLSGVRRDWPEVVALDANGAPELRSVPVDNAPGTTSDGHHTFEELYAYRAAFHAAFAWELANDGFHRLVKSWRHHDGTECFGGGWFIVIGDLPNDHGQISNHYPAADWDLFHVPEVDRAPAWDGHTPAEALERIRTYLET